MQRYENTSHLRQDTPSFSKGGRDVAVWQGDARDHTVKAPLEERELLGSAAKKLTMRIAGARNVQ